MLARTCDVRIPKFGHRWKCAERVASEIDDVVVCSSIKLVSHVDNQGTYPIYFMKSIHVQLTYET